MENLLEKVQAMLNGEIRRREVAIDFIDDIVEILNPVAIQIWGEGTTLEEPHTIWLCHGIDNIRNGFGNIYYRYRAHHENDRCYQYLNEPEGFYSSKQQFAIRGTEVEDLQGDNFWEAVQIIMDWIPIIVSSMDTRSSSREELLKRIIV